MATTLAGRSVVIVSHKRGLAGSPITDVLDLTLTALTKSALKR